MNLRKEYGHLKVSASRDKSRGPIVALLTSTISIQTYIFAGRIEEQFEAKCLTFESSSLPPFEKLKIEYLILDCVDLAIENLDQILRNIHLAPSPPNIILLNIVETEGLDTILHWKKVLGLMPVESDPSKIMERLNQIFSGKSWLSRSVLNNLQRNHRKPKYKPDKSSNLTQRERQILLLICDCNTNANIAETLFVSEHTVKSHLYKIYRKIGCKNRLEASGWANRNLQMK
ncbi:helix-turn-helix transcriptional regulator [Microbulbifer sp. GL-2]|uniref:helix-turn-helix transcriptional regulator n=1 Tax=Microbulbifer sp. GL-2 TaxID=2591606 RepID=UPI001164224D|nr:response regulator transcription factor [Microbulbifer sp. GL-2]BBM02198.1 hypothetical protein GL2_22720 [Microbulbifer sp. GL-2]